MISLKEKPTAGLDISRLSYPINEDTVSLSNYLSRSGNVTYAPFWSAGVPVCESVQRPPEVYRLAQPGGDGLPKLGSVETFDLDAAAPAETRSRFHSWNVTVGLSPYMVVAFFLAVAAGEGVLLVTGTDIPDRAVLEAAVVPGAEAKTEIAALFSFASANDTGVTATPLLPLSMAGGREWPETVDTFRNLLAQRQTSQASAIKQVENDRLLGRLDAWLKAKAR